MTKIHTPLGVISSSKKIILGIAAIAMIGGGSSMLMNGTYAKEVYYDPDETIFTAVGPDYVTRIYDELSYYRENDYNISITDTDVADFYENHRMKGCDYYQCIQGKKIGDTEIVLRKTGENTVRIPVRSVELSPEAYIFEEVGKQISITGSLNGADDSLLSVYDTFTEGGVRITETGERSLSVRSIDDGDSYVLGGIAGIMWQIGNQQVAGTYCAFMRAEGVDNVYHLPENEKILKDAAMSLFVSFEMVGVEPIPGSTFTTIDGSTFRLENIEGDSDTEPIKLQGALDLNDAKTTETLKNKLKAKLPDGAKDVTFKDITVSVNIFTREESVPSFHTDSLMQQPLAQTSTVTDDGDMYVVGYYETLSKPITMVIDVSDVAEVAKGYTRKWYVARDNDGTIERLDAAYDKDTKTIRFETQVFGLHAYGYVDEKTAPLVPDTGTAPEKVAMVATATFAPLAAIALGAFIARSKKKAANRLAKNIKHFE